MGPGAAGGAHPPAGSPLAPLINATSNMKNMKIRPGLVVAGARVPRGPQETRRFENEFFSLTKIVP